MRRYNRVELAAIAWPDTGLQYRATLDEEGGVTVDSMSMGPVAPSQQVQGWQKQGEGEWEYVGDYICDFDGDVPDKVLSIVQVELYFLARGGTLKKEPKHALRSAVVAAAIGELYNFHARIRQRRASFSESLGFLLRHAADVPWPENEPLVAALAAIGAHARRKPTDDDLPHAIKSLSSSWYSPGEAGLRGSEGFLKLMGVPGLSGESPWITDSGLSAWGMMFILKQLEEVGLPELEGAE